MFESEILNKYRMDIVFYKKIKKSDLINLFKKIKDCLDNSKYNEWQEVEGVKFSINSRETFVELPPLHVRQCMLRVGTTPTKLAPENAEIQVIFNPFDSKELQKVRQIIREARNQLPKTSRGIIILETNHTERMVKVAEEKLKQTGYEHIITILITGKGAFSVPNPLHQNFPIDFIKIAVV